MKISTLILTILVCFSTIVDAQGTQNRANELMKQAQSSLEQKEYTKARYLFIQAYGAFAAQENYPKAVECGIQGAALYHRENKRSRSNSIRCAFKSPKRDYKCISG